MSDAAAETALDAPLKASSMGREVAVANQGGAVMVAPENLANMIEFAQLMSKGGSMVGKPFRDKPGACLGIASQAWRWGMDPYSCSQKAYDVGGTIGYEAQLVHAVILKNAPIKGRPDIVYIGDDDARQCIVTFEATDSPKPLVYTSPKIGKIPTKNSPLWKGDPDQQLGYYSVRAACRRHFPDIIMGVYTPEEIKGASQAIGDAGEVFTLGSSGGADDINQDQVRDAEFTPIDPLLKKNAPAKENGDQSKPAAAKEGDGASVKGPTSKGKARAKAADTPADTAASPKADDSATHVLDGEAGLSKPGPAANDDATGQADADREDDTLVARIEAEVRAAKTEKSKPIRDNRGALNRIAEMHGDEAVRARAEALLNKFDLDN